MSELTEVDCQLLRAENRMATEMENSALDFLALLDSIADGSATEAQILDYLPEKSVVRSKKRKVKRLRNKPQSTRSTAIRAAIDYCRSVLNDSTDGADYAAQSAFLARQDEIADRWARIYGKRRNRKYIDRALDDAHEKFAMGGVVLSAPRRAHCIPRAVIAGYCATLEKRRTNSVLSDRTFFADDSAGIQWASYGWREITEMEFSARKAEIGLLRQYRVGSDKCREVVVSIEASAMLAMEGAPESDCETIARNTEPENRIPRAELPEMVVSPPIPHDCEMNTVPRKPRHNQRDIALALRRGLITLAYAKSLAAGEI